MGFSKGSSDKGVMKGHQRSPELGPLYDCSEVKPKSILPVNRDIDCREGLMDAKDQVEIFRADVKKMIKTPNPITLYMCKATRLDLYCSEGFWGTWATIPKWTVETPMRVEPGDCEQAVNDLTNQYGPLRKIAPGEYSTNKHIDYKCKWDTDNVNTNEVVFELTEFKAHMIGLGEKIEQALTSDKMEYKNHQHRPVEDPLALIMWKQIQRKDNIYRTLGKQVEIHRVNDYIYVMGLGLGGMVLDTSEKGDGILLTNGLVVERMNKHEGDLTKFYGMAKKYAGNFTNGKLSVALGQAHLAATAESSLTNFRALYQLSCQQNKLYQSLLNHVLKHFPDTGHELVGYEGHTLQDAGDALIVSKCRKVSDYQVSWNRRIGDKCYKSYPVRLKGNVTRYLNLLKRELVPKAEDIPCEERPKITMVRGMDKLYYVLDQNGRMTEEPLDLASDERYVSNHIPRGILVNESFFREPEIDRVSQLRIVNAASMAVINVQKIHNKYADVSAGIIEDINYVLKKNNDGEDGLVGDVTGIFDHVFGFAGGSSSNVIRSLTQKAGGFAAGATKALIKLVKLAVQILNEIGQWVLILLLIRGVRQDNLNGKRFIYTIDEKGVAM